MTGVLQKTYSLVLVGMPLKLTTSFYCRLVPESEIILGYEANTRTSFDFVINGSVCQPSKRQLHQSDRRRGADDLADQPNENL